MYSFTIHWEGRAYTVRTEVELSALLLSLNTLKQLAA
jgi:hypothetical protein